MQPKGMCALTAMCLSQNDLKLKATKCVLFRTDLQFPGHELCKGGVKADMGKIEEIQNWPRSKTEKVADVFGSL